MSSLVQAKCTNSVMACSSGVSAMRSLMKYSTALTSWLVVRSISLMRSASATEKSRTRHPVPRWLRLRGPAPR